MLLCSLIILNTSQYYHRPFKKSTLLFDSSFHFYLHSSILLIHYAFPHYTAQPHCHLHIYIFILYFTAPISTSTSFLSVLDLLSALPFFSHHPFHPFVSSLYLSTSNLRDGLENVLWHFFHHLGPILSTSAWTPRPLCCIVCTEHYPAGSALPLCLHIASLYTCSPSCTSQNLPTQCRDRYQSTDIPHPL